MKKVNFKEVDVYTDITRTRTQKADVRKDFANILYTGCDGIMAHSLALRIYEGDGEIEVDDAEADFILNVMERRCTPAFIDGIRNQLEK